MVCKKCGGNINEDTGLCFNCGEPADSGRRKFKTVYKILLAAGAVVIVLLILVMVNLAAVSNFMRRTFSSPEDYYHYVEKQTVEKISYGAGDFYGRYFLEQLHVTEQSASVRMDMTLGEAGQELMRLAGLSGVDMSWFESVTLNMDSAVSKEALSTELGIVLNGVDIVTSNMIVDLEEEAVYLQVPEINGRYMKLDTSDSGFDDMEEVWAMYEMLERVCPDQEAVENLLNRYLTIAVECMGDVRKSKDVLEVRNVEQKCTVLTVTANKNTWKEMAVEILRQMREDEEIAEIIRNAAGEEDFVREFALDEMSPDEAYEQFQEWIDTEITELEDIGELEILEDETLVMHVYVDNKGKIAGRTIEMGNVEIRMLMPEKDRQFGYELSYEDSSNADLDYEQSIVLKGSGRRDGDMIEGKFALFYQKTPVVEIKVEELDAQAMKKGLPNGRVILGLSDDAVDLFGYTPGMSMIQGVELSLDFASDETSGSCNIGVSLRDRGIVDIVTAYQREKGYHGAEPGQDAVMVEDMDDLIEWGRDLDFGGLSASLKEADVPSEVTDALDFFEGMDLEAILRMMYLYY